MPVGVDDAEQLVAEHELRAAVGRHAEDALGDLSIGAADADLQYAQEQLAVARAHGGNVGDMCRPGGAWSGDEPLHRQLECGSSTAPSEAELTSAR